MSGAHFQINQAANSVPTGTTDIARIDIYQSQTVHFVGESSAGQTSPSWTILGWADGATRSQPSNQNTFDANYSFATPGSYLFEYLVGDGIGANKKRFVVRVTRDANGLLYDDGVAEPAFGEEVGDDNAASNDRGYAKVFEIGLARQMPAIDSVATLLARRGNRHKHVNLLGYYTPGDGGGGRLRWDASSTATHDGGLVFQPGFGTGGAVATGRWIRNVESRISVKWFGAKGDGVADDRLPIQAALDASYARVITTTVPTSFSVTLNVKSGPDTFFPLGKYLVSRRFPTPGVGYRYALLVLDNVRLTGERGTQIVPDSSTQDQTTGYAAIKIASNNNSIHGLMFLNFFTVFSFGGLALFAGDSVGGISPSVGSENPNFCTECSFVGIRGPVFWMDPGPATTVAAGSDGQALNALSGGILHVADASQFTPFTPGNIFIRSALSPDGNHLGVAFTGKTSNTFTGCTSSSSVVVHTGDVVTTAFDVGGPQMPWYVSRCKFFCPHALFSSGEMYFTHNTFGIDQSNFTPQVSDTGRPLPVFENVDHMIIAHSLFEMEGQGVGSPVPPDRLVLWEGHGSVWVRDCTMFDHGSAIVRAIGGVRSAGGKRPPAFKGLADAATDVGLGKAAQIHITGNILSAVSRNVVECYDTMPQYIEIRGNENTNLGITRGVYINDSVDLDEILKTHADDLRIEIDERDPVNRFRFGSEANVISDTGLVDVTDRFIAHHVKRPIDAEDSAPQVNLFPADCIDSVSSGMVLSTTTMTTSGTESVSGYALAKYAATAENARFSLTSPRVLQSCTEGVYYFSLEYLADFDGMLQFTTTLDGIEAVTIQVRIHDTGGQLQRIGAPFYYPGGAANSKVAILVINIPNGAHFAPGLFAIHHGLRAAPYTRPTDVASAPTTQLTNAKRVATYYGPTLPTTGTYQIGDRFVVDNPVGGLPGRYRCVVGGIAPNFVFEVETTITDSTNPVTPIGVPLHAALEFNNSGGTVNAGTSVTKTVTITGAERGDEVRIIPFQNPGDGWVIQGEISTTNQVRVTVSNVTGANAAIPGDPFGLDVHVIKHPAAERLFPSPKGWLTADTGYDGSTGLWTDQFGKGNNFGPQASAGLRPTLVTGVSGVGGHSVLRGTTGGATRLPGTWTFGTKNSLLWVVGGFAATANVIYARGGGGNFFLRYNRTGAKEHEFQVGSPITIGTSVADADFHIFGAAQDDSGNLRLFFDGVKTHDAAAPGAWGNITDLFSNAGFNVPNIDWPVLLWYGTDMSDAQMIEASLRLKGKFNL